MELSHWLQDQWFEFVQTLGIVVSFLLTAYTIWQDARARRIENFIAIKQQYREIWDQARENPSLFRVRRKDIDLELHPVSDEERLFVRTLLFHLDTVHRAMKAGMFVKLEGLEKDIKGFFNLPIPGAVWKELKAFQNDNFVRFVESNRL